VLSLALGVVQAGGRVGGGGYQGGQGLHDQDVSMLQLGLVEGLALVHLLHHHLGLKLHLLCHLHPTMPSYPFSLS